MHAKTAYSLLSPETPPLLRQAPAKHSTGAVSSTPDVNTEVLQTRGASRLWLVSLMPDAALTRLLLCREEAGAAASLTQR